MYLKKQIIKYNFNYKKLKPRVFTFSLRAIPLNNLTLLTNMSGSQPMYYINTRDRPRFFDQVGHQTTNASIGNNHFFTK